MDRKSNFEKIVRSTIDGTEYEDPPRSRMEELLLELKDHIGSGGSDGGGGVVPPGEQDFDDADVEDIMSVISTDND